MLSERCSDLDTTQLVSSISFHELAMIIVYHSRAAVHNN
jgi:hypothetical protein